MKGIDHRHVRIGFSKRRLAPTCIGCFSNLRLPLINVQQRFRILIKPNSLHESELCPPWKFARVDKYGGDQETIYTPCPSLASTKPRSIRNPRLNSASRLYQHSASFFVSHCFAVWLSLAQGERIKLPVAASCHSLQVLTMWRLYRDKFPMSKQGHAGFSM